MKFNRIVISTILLINAFVSLDIFAVHGNVKGKVDVIRVITGKVNDAVWQNAGWFKVSGVTTAGSCATRSSNDFGGTPGLVAFRLEPEDASALSLLLSAQAQDREVAVYWDDSIKTVGYCNVLATTIL